MHFIVWMLPSIGVLLMAAARNNVFVYFGVKPPKIPPDAFPK